jgi:DnaK suppressor protein
MQRTESETTRDTAEASRDDIRQRLVARRDQLLGEIHHRVRDAREAGSNGHYAIAGPGDTAEPDPEDDLAFALLHLKGELLARVDEAVRRCDEGTYGYCDDCGEGIAASRLRAVPFAVRCRDCEETREAAQHRTQAYAQRVPPRLGGDTFV